jgi:hypothetical protein
MWLRLTKPWPVVSPKGKRMVVPAHTALNWEMPQWHGIDLPRMMPRHVKALDWEAAELLSQRFGGAAWIWLVGGGRR